MINSFKNRVFGCAIIKSLNSNYNADFSHQPRTLPDGVVYATDKVLKYSVRNFWNDFYKEEKIFFFKSLDEKMKPRTLDERYISLFGAHKTTITSDKFSVFEFDGESVTGKIPDKPKAKDIKALFKEMDEDNEYKVFEKTFNIIAGPRTSNIARTDEIKISADPLQEESYFFYLDKDNKQVRIEGESSDIISISNLVLDAMGGGINRQETLKELLKCLDIRLFGATYAGKTNISIHGTTQISHGINRFVRGDKFSEQIMSPFRNPGDKNIDSTMTTLGSQSKLHEGHYVHHFSVNPKNIEDDAILTKGNNLSQDDISKLKEGLRKGVTYYDSAAKAGTDNELLLWIQLKEESKAVLPSFVEMVTINEEKEIDLILIKELLNKPHIKVEIEKVELYYNSVTTKVINAPDIAQHIEL